MMLLMVKAMPSAAAYSAVVAPPQVVSVCRRSSFSVSLRSVALSNRLDLLPPRPPRNRALKDAVAAVTEQIIAGGGRLPTVEHLLTRSPLVFVDGVRPAGVILADGNLLETVAARARAEGVNC